MYCPIEQINSPLRTAVLQASDLLDMVVSGGESHLLPQLFDVQFLTALEEKCERGQKYSTGGSGYSAVVIGTTTISKGLRLSERNMEGRKPFGK